MSILYNEPEPKILPWEQYWIWTKSMFWLPSEDEDLKEEIHGATKAGPSTGMLEATLLSEKVVMYTVDDCILSEIQTEILATLLPTELITQDTLLGKTRSHFVGVLMFGDVSGFTALCEKYFAEGGKGGTYKLTATLNCYIGAMVDVIYSYGGDVIKFSGDAFLAVWRVSINDYIYEIVHKVVECAMNIQHSLGSYETDVNVLLRVKLAVSAGNVVFSSIGEEASKYYVIVGEAVDDVKEAQDTCVSGDVVLAPSAWGHCSQVNYLYTFKDEKHIKILRIIYHPMQVNRKVFQLPPKFIVDLEKKYRYQITRYRQLDSVIDLSSTKYETVRPEVTLAAERGLGPYLRPYLIPPVVAQVDAEQPLEYLTEMRQVITVFINLVLEKKGTLDTIDRVDEVYTKIWQVVHRQMGVVNKVCMFDKDIMFLVIFGLRGAHHEYNAMKALKCAYKIRGLISPLPQVLCISCGVTIGMTYCGVVGHPLRQEYTVIGAPVNKAARLMMYYPGRVACDQQVYFSSGLSSIYFIEQEQKTLKGIGKVGGIYEYTEGRRGMGNVNIYHLPPLLGQESELNTFRNMLQGGEGFPVGFLYQGQSGIGKSRLFEEFLIMCVNRYFKTIFLTLQSSNSGTPCFVLQQIFKQVLSAVASNEDLKGKNEKVMALLENTEYERFAFLLNPILNLSIPDKCPPEMFTLNLHEVRVLRDSVFKKLVNVACVDMILFIDNIEFCDSRSADLLPIFLQEGTTALVMSANKKSSPKIRKWFKNVKLIICELLPLDEDYLAPLACQLLGVRAISKELVELIESQPEATPGWCQRYLQSLLDSRVIHIEKMARKHLKTFEDMVIPDFKLLQKRVIGQELRPNRITFVNFPSKGESMDDEVSICTVVKTAEGLELTFPGTMEAVIMSAFDCLSPYEQLLLKCGSVIGDTFPREMLHAILFKRSPRETAQAIKRLFEMHILCCSNTEDVKGDVYSYDLKSIDTNLTLAGNFEVCCYCKQRTTHDDFEDAYSFPYYAFCNELQFTVPLFRCKTYDLLPLNQKALFHTRVAAFLELKLHQPDYLKFGVPNYWRALLKAMSTLTSMAPSEAQPNKQKELEFRNFSFKFTDRFNPSLYEDIISHLNKAGHKDREILVLIEYGQAALLAGCSRRAVNALHLAEDKLSEMSHSREFRENYDLIHLRGKIHVIAAQGYLDLRYLETSRSELYKAQRLLFGTSFQYYLFHATKPSFANSPRRAIHRSKFFHWLFRSKATLCLTKTEYLNVLCNSLMINSEWHRAKSISHKAILTMMKCAKQNVCLVYNTFSNLIDIYIHLGKFNKATKFYNFALKVASSLPFDENDIVQQISRARLDTTFYTCSFLQGHLELCYEMGESLHKMSLQLGSHDAALYISTIRLNVLMRMKKYEKFAAANENFRSQVRSNLTKVHYYINCVMFHLYSGVVIKSAYDILLLLEYNKLQLSRPLCNVLGVYLIRRNELKLHKYIENELKPPMIINKYNIHYEIIYLEYWLMKTFKMIDNKELKDVTEINEVMNKLYTFIIEIKRTVAECTPHLLPRLFLLIAYYNQLKDNEARSNRYLKAGLQLSLQFGDELEYEWMSHNKQMWSNINKAKHLGTNPSYTDGWRSHSTYNTHVHVFDYERFSPSNLLFTLPLLIEGTGVSVSDVPWDVDTTSAGSTTA